MSGRAPPLRALIALAVPMVVARSTQSVIGFADALMVAPLGPEALAATTTGALNTIVVILLPMGISFILQSFSAQLSGKGDLAAVRRYAWYGLILAAVSGVVSAAAIPVLGPALGLFHHAPRVHELMTGFVAIRLLAVGAIVGTEALGNWYGGLGNTWMQMVAGVVAMVLNVFLNWVFIYGHLGAPALGVHGSALASTIASTVGFLVVLISFLRGVGLPAQVRATRGQPLGLRRDEMLRMLRFGLPSGLNWFLEFAAFFLFINLVVGHLGTETLAAMNVVIQINSVSFMPAFGIASAGAILAGQAIGRGEPDAVWPVVVLTLRATIGWMVGIGLLYLIAPSTLLGWFASGDHEHPTHVLISVGSSILVISAAWQLFDATALTLSETLRAAGDTAWCALARVILAWLVFTPCAVVWVIYLHGGAVPATLCVVFYNAALAATMVWRFRTGAWRRIDLTGSPAA